MKSFSKFLQFFSKRESNAVYAMQTVLADYTFISIF